ncbi:hypothetical protein LCD36_04465 [Saccharopolyspora sp. 6T]|uniref:hypothetical protein n=1 Tax=Saccharopolyspora sp. 6T TaxID=2877238 RepID=UPI001CD616DB|nr:hypothetical protein [Saccharopolyspora sp. 6T]MCA1185705.1 hypothetical protein [Saccharopolyspora sp. 6T]
MTQGTQEPLDLNALFTARSLEPRRVTVAGAKFDVRRDLTSEEVITFFEKSATGKNFEALTMLVGEEAAREVDSKLAILPAEHVTKVFRRLMQIAGVLNRLPEDEQEEPEGESSASSPRS